MNSPTSAPLPTTRSAPFILVVEDSILLRFTLTEWLRLTGYNVIEAVSADEAIELLSSVITIDFVISDVDMPGTVNGYDLALHIQKHFPSLPFILVSGNISRKKIEEIGKVEFIPKPYDFTQLGKRIDILLPPHKRLGVE